MHPVPKTPFAVRYPLLMRGGIALLLMGITRVAVALGWFPPQWELSETGVEQLLDGIYLAWAWVTSQQHVTPVADPRDDHGRPLVVQGRVEPR